MYFIAEPLDIFVSPSTNTLLVWSITFATCERAAPASDGIESKILWVSPNKESSLKPYFVDNVSKNTDCSWFVYSALFEPNLFFEFLLYQVKLPPILPPSVMFLELWKISAETLSNINDR